jgi:cytochrome c
MKTNMKKIFLPVLSIVLFTACGGGNSQKENTKPAAANDLSSNPDYQKGLALVSKSDCFTCHKVDEQLTGPAYRDVANKYAGMPDTIITHLAHKVINGGSGNWGSVMMLPHASLSEEDAKAMVKYILLLKK